MCSIVYWFPVIINFKNPTRIQQFLYHTYNQHTIIKNLKRSWHSGSLSIPYLKWTSIPGPKSWKMTQLTMKIFYSYFQMHRFNIIYLKRVCVLIQSVKFWTHMEKVWSKMAPFNSMWAGNHTQKILNLNPNCTQEVSCSQERGGSNLIYSYWGGGPWEGTK